MKLNAYCVPNYFRQKYFINLALFQIYNHSGNGHLTLQEFIKVLKHTLQMCDEEAEDIFYQINKNNQKHITFGK